MCNQDFFRRWSVEYLDEPQFSGEIEISQRGGGIFVSGSINKNGTLDGSYTSNDAVCSGRENNFMQFTYVLSTGNTGRLSLSFSASDGAIILEGTYRDNGGGGDQGRVRLRPVVLTPNEVGNNFTFIPEITNDQRLKLIERHRFAYSQIMACGNLREFEKTALIFTYGRTINHYIENDPNANASAIVGGSTLNVNFGVLFPQGDNEIAQTLIHEMMHCAGFSHPARMISDVPNDGGIYFSSPPLQAEICIAGVQSDQICSMNEKGQCVVRNLQKSDSNKGFASP
jgi:hypothetical protein